MKRLLSLTIVFFLMVVVTTSCGIESNSGEPKMTAKDSPNYRPSFHFAPDSNWTNDPNGLVYYNGQYHLFFQYNPFGDTWGHMSWGHALSTDLMNWNQLPIALLEQYAADSTPAMIFSGTAITDSFNTSGFGTYANPTLLVAIYTSHFAKSGKEKQTQHIAYSLNGEDFVFYDKNPVLDIGAKDFRDPKVFWHADTKKWIMILSKPDEYKLKLYSSTNLKNWKWESDFGGNIGNKTKIWECPDLFPLIVAGSNEIKWVVTVSAGHPDSGYLAMQYFIGSFDGKTFVADSLPYPLYLDLGKDYYAGIVYNNLSAKDGRTIMIGWANCWEYANQIPTKGFRGMMAIPRALTLESSADGTVRLTQNPVKEIENYHNKILFSKASLAVNNILPLDDVNDDALDISFNLKTGDASQAGIKVLQHGEEATTIYFDKASNSIYLDRTKSGNTSFSKRFASIEKVPLPVGTKEISLRILVDKSLIEVFINGGMHTLTNQVFPTQRGGEVSLFSNGGTSTFSNLSLFSMKPSMH